MQTQVILDTDEVFIINYCLGLFDKPKPTKRFIEFRNQWSQMYIAMEKHENKCPALKKLSKKKK